MKTYSTKVKCFFDNELIAEHNKKSGFCEWIIDLNYYLATFKRKPGALASSAAMNQASAKIKHIYKQYYSKKEREFIELLQYMKETGRQADEVIKAIEELLMLSPFSEITTDKLKIMFARHEEKPVQIVVDTEILEKSISLLKIYGQLVACGNSTGEVIL